MYPHASRGRARSPFRFLAAALAGVALAALTGAAAAQQEMPKVNLNTATAEALQYIPGIGPGRSADIIAFREQNGGLQTVEDLLAIDGIGEKTLIDIARFGTLDGGVSELTEEMAANPPTRPAASDSGG